MSWGSTLDKILDTGLGIAQSQLGGNSTPQTVAVTPTSTSTPTSAWPNWVKPVGIGVGVLVVGFILWQLFRGK